MGSASTVFPHCAQTDTSTSGPPQILLVTVPDVSTDGSRSSVAAPTRWISVWLNKLWDRRVKRTVTVSHPSHDPLPRNMLTRSDECQPPSNWLQLAGYLNVNGSICLNFTCLCVTPLSPHMDVRLWLTERSQLRECLGRPDVSDREHGVYRQHRLWCYLCLRGLP